jgi:hypothetical protein
MNIEKIWSYTTVESPIDDFTFVIIWTLLINLAIVILLQIFLSTDEED